MFTVYVIEGTLQDVPIHINVCAVSSVRKIYRANCCIPAGKIKTSSASPFLRKYFGIFVVYSIGLNFLKFHYGNDSSPAFSCKMLALSRYEIHIRSMISNRIKEVKTLILIHV